MKTFENPKFTPTNRETGEPGFFTQTVDGKEIKFRVNDMVRKGDKLNETV